MTDFSSIRSFPEETRVLVPLRLPDPDPISPWLQSFLDSVRVHVLGCYVVPDQTSPEQAREQFGDDARESLDEVAGEFREFTADVESSLVFTRDMVQSVERVSSELEVDAIVEPRQVAPIRSVLAVVTRAIDYERFVKSVAALVSEEIERLRIVQVGGQGEDPQEQDLMLDGLEARLSDRGIDPEVIETEALKTSDPTGDILSSAEEFDIVIIAEREPTLTGRLAGTIAESVYRDCDAPVVLVRLPE